MPLAKFEVKSTTIGQTTVVPTFEGWMDESSIVFDSPPRFEFTTENESGVKTHQLKSGKEIEIFRLGQRRFVGVIETIEPSGSARDGNSIKITGIQKGYKLLQARICDSYDFDENNNPGDTRDAVTVNPWTYLIFRESGSTLNKYGDERAVDGIKPNEILQCLIGTKFIHQSDFFDNGWFKASQVYTTTNKLQVYRDQTSGDLRPVLQLNRLSETTFETSGNVESIPLENGNPNIDVMGDVSTVAVTIVGKRNAIGDNPTIQVCRNARGARVYTAVALGFTAAYRGSGLDAWTGTIDLSGDGSATKNSLAYKIAMTLTSGNPTKIHYIRLDAVTTSDTGVTNGTIASYVNPTIDIDGYSEEKDWLEIDLLNFDRMKAIEVVRKLTESSTSSNVSPHWDAHVNDSLQFNFAERRGANIAGHPYSFADRNISEISHEFYGGEVTFQTIAIGPGSGVAQTTIVSKQEFSAGGLYDSDRDPSAVSPVHGKNARVMFFIDQNERSAVALLRKARAYHKLHRDPIENVKIDINAEFIVYFNVGDGLEIKDVKTRTNAFFRVIALRRSWSGSDTEKLRVELGEPVVDTAKRIAGGDQKANTLTVRPQPSQSITGISGDGIYFDTNLYGVFGFAISEGSAIDRVSLRFQTLPWLATARTTVPQAATQSATSAASVSFNNVTPLELLVDYGSDQSILSADLILIKVKLQKTAVGVTSPAAPAVNIQYIVSAASAALGSAATQVLDGGRGYVDFGDGETFDLIIPLRKEQVPAGLLNNIRYVKVQLFSDFDTNITATSTTLTSYIYFAPGLDFGIYRFDGDAPPGQPGVGPPIYGTGIRFAVDPDDADGDGTPTTAEFNAKRHPIAFGNRLSPTSIDADVTGWLRAETNGTVKNGVHNVFFISGVDTNNSEGLSVVSVTPVVKFRRSGASERFF